jgi:hypothetical protein
VGAKTLQTPVVNDDLNPTFSSEVRTSEGCNCR